MNDATPTTYRIDRDTLKGDLPILALLGLDFAYGAYSLGRMPARVPVHWGLSGEPDAFGPPWMNAFLIPLLGLVVYLMLLVLPLLDPKRTNHALFTDTARFFRFLLVVFVVAFHVVVIRVSMGDRIPMDFVLRLSLAILIGALGNRFGRLRQNFLIGIRVPWTLSSEEVWNRTHRLAGRLWVAGGIVLVGAAFLPLTTGIAAFVVVLTVLVAVPVYYSWRIYQREVGARADG